MNPVSTNGNIVNYMGLSTETKPTEGLATGSLFIELDTGTVYYFNADTSAWAVFGGGGSNG